LQLNKTLRRGRTRRLGGHLLPGALQLRDVVHPPASAPAGQVVPRPAQPALALPLLQREGVDVEELRRAFTIQESLRWFRRRRVLRRHLLPSPFQLRYGIDSRRPAAGSLDRFGRAANPPLSQPDVELVRLNSEQRRRLIPVHETRPRERRRRRAADFFD
jgi:hypothetical protein